MVEYNSKEYRIQNYDKSKWEEYERIELAWFAQSARDSHAEICLRLNFTTLVDSHDILKKIDKLRMEITKSKTIRDDWDTLNKHMEENPTIKEEWEGILMAIRLTEED